MSNLPLQLRADLIRSLTRPGRGVIAASAATVAADRIVRAVKYHRHHFLTSASRDDQSHHPGENRWFDQWRARVLKSAQKLQSLLEAVEFPGDKLAFRRSEFDALNASLDLTRKLAAPESRLRGRPRSLRVPLASSVGFYLHLAGVKITTKPDGRFGRVLQLVYAAIDEPERAGGYERDLQLVSKNLTERLRLGLPSRLEELGVGNIDELLRRMGEDLTSCARMTDEQLPAAVRRFSRGAISRARTAT